MWGVGFRALALGLRVYPRNYGTMVYVECMPDL